MAGATDALVIRRSRMLISSEVNKAINQQIGHVFVGGGDNSSIFDQCFHN